MGSLQPTTYLLTTALMQRVDDKARTLPYYNRRCDDPSYCERRWTVYYRGSWHRVDDLVDGTMIEKYYCGSHVRAARRRVAKKIEAQREES